MSLPQGSLGIAESTLQNWASKGQFQSPRIHYSGSTSEELLPDSNYIGDFRGHTGVQTHIHIGVHLALGKAWAVG